MVRIHTDKLTERIDFQEALTRAGLEDVWIEDFSEHGSRSRRRAFEVRLAANPMRGRRPRMTGTRGAEDGTYQKAATYDEHGEWIAQLYLADPLAIVGPYKDEDDFHRQTKQKYRIDPVQAHNTRQEVRA